MKVCHCGLDGILTLSKLRLVGFPAGCVRISRCENERCRFPFTQSPTPYLVYRPASNNWQTMGYGFILQQYSCLT